MKATLVSVLAVVALAVLCSGCATPYPVGTLFTEVSLPVAATPNAVSTKVGTAKCTSILTWVATGDASLEAAKKNGGITKVSHVDWKAKNFLGIYGEYTVTVYGE